MLKPIILILVGTVMLTWAIIKIVDCVVHDAYVTYYESLKPKVICLSGYKFIQTLDTSGSKEIQQIMPPQECQE